MMKSIAVVSAALLAVSAGA
jgi:hypothetical protein